MNFTEIIKQVEDHPYSGFFYTPVYYKKAVSYLLLRPIEIVSVYKKDDLDYAFKLIQKLIKKNYFGYSLINYEAGFLFEQKLEVFLKDENKKLIQFVFFDESGTRKLKSSKIIFDDRTKTGYLISGFRMNKSEAQFTDDIQKIKQHIKEGDTYQVNYTVKGKFKFSGSPSLLFQKLLFNQSARYSAIINNDEEFIVSLSPELFFSKRGKRILSKPMKGTIHRGLNHSSDSLLEKELVTSEKDRAENVMIVDLIRNDFGKICNFGSVTVPELFKTEKYESLYQLVSTVRGRLKRKTKIREIIKSIFPCGSVTGAPKIRTMEIINEIEKENRDIYTGSIGLITPQEIKMNVAIRTVTLSKSNGEGVIGLGSGIVWDSDPNKEYEEVLLKSNFLTHQLDYFEIFETMRYENGSIKFISEHLNRMKIASDYFLFKYNYKNIVVELEKSILTLDKNVVKKIKLSLTKWGEIKIEISDITEINDEVSMIISESRINSGDPFRYFKTTNRKLYDDEYSIFNSDGFYEVLYLNEKEEVTEGSRSNIFLRKGNSWFTPPSTAGILPGIFRKYFMLTNSDVSEKSLRIEDLIKADELILTNALRGDIKVNKLFINQREFIEFQSFSHVPD
ncbi:MAG: aminodeoxychorismate synthase component I [Ignavibacteriales bacterium]